jgi:site-specific DNA-methyltransferase (adenine-specific)
MRYWELGNAAIYEAKSELFIPELGTEFVDCVWADPPYFLSNGGTTCSGGERVSVDKGDWDKSQGTEKDYEFTFAWLSRCHEALKENGTIWVSGTLHVYPLVAMAMKDIGFRLLNDIVWEKTNPPPNIGRRCFTHSTEILLWAAKSEKSKHVFHYDEMRKENGGKQMKNVWRYTRPMGKEVQFGGYPAQKPVALIDRCLRSCTNKGDIILDPFMGSGSSGVAAVNLERNYIGIDEDPKAFDLAQKRLSLEKPT